MSEPRKLIVELPAGLTKVSANDRPLTYVNRKGARIPLNSRDIKNLREEAGKAVAAQSFSPFEKVKIRCIFRAPDNRKRDIANLYPSFKPCIDALVDKGVIPDDDDRHVVELTLVRGENLPRVKNGQLVLEVIEVEE